jgi:hypothetical protein
MNLKTMQNKQYLKSQINFLITKQMENLNRIKREVLRRIEENVSQVESAHKLHDFVNEIIETIAKRETRVHKNAIQIMADLELYSWGYFNYPQPTDVTAVAYKGLKEVLESDFRNFYLQANMLFAREQKLV